MYKRNVIHCESLYFDHKLYSFEVYQQREYCEIYVNDEFYASADDLTEALGEINILKERVRNGQEIM